MNAYRDYAKWRDQVLMSQNNCELRCIEEEKINNTDNAIESHCTARINHNDNTVSLDNRQNHANHKSASNDATTDDANYNSESEAAKIGKN